MRVVCAPETNAASDEDVVASDVVGDIADPKLVEKIGIYARDSSCNGEVEVMKEEERCTSINVAVDDVGEEVEKIGELSNGFAYAINHNVGITVEDGNAEHESLTDETKGTVDVELVSVELMKEEEVTNQQGRRRKIWPKVTSFFLLAATSVAFILLARRKQS